MKHAVGLAVLISAASACSSQRDGSERREAPAAGDKDDGTGDRCSAAGSAWRRIHERYKGPESRFVRLDVIEKAATGSCGYDRWPSATIDCVIAHGARAGDAGPGCDLGEAALRDQIQRYAIIKELALYDPAACELYATEIKRLGECPAMNETMRKSHEQELAGVKNPVDDEGALICIKSLGTLDITLTEAGCKGVP